jgi:hypothetical protein
MSKIGRGLKPGYGEKYVESDFGNTTVKHNVVGF